MKKNVLLIQPKFFENFHIKPPIPLMYIAAVLENNGFNVTIIDTNIEKDYIKKITDYIKNKKPEYVGISVMIGLQIISAKLISQKIKKTNPQTNIVWGGPFPTCEYELVIKEPYVDIVVIGEGEDTFLELVKNKDKNLIKGIIYKNKNKIVLNTSREIIDINQLPPPAFHLVKMKKYQAAYVHMTRGCPFKCSFCHISSTGPFRGKTPEKMMEEVSLIIRNGFTKIDFRGEAQLCNKQIIETFCSLIRKNNLSLTWTSWAHVKYLKNKEYVRMLAANGLRQVLIGVESYSTEKRRELKKYFSNEELFQTLKNCKEAGIYAILIFIIGYPKQRKDDINKILDFADLIEKQYGFQSLISVYKNYPLTKLSKRHRKKNLEEWAYTPFFIKSINRAPKNINTLECISHSFHYKQIYEEINKSRASLMIKFLRFIATKRCKYRMWKFPVEIYLKKIKILGSVFIEKIKLI
ncbi:MAG: B12-binding domain-containing radical SAM protein [Nanoarchaeota archaeon]|nr:B12-binding domain-containing radical SAM protein [Nanoarchaeota archaeon]MBU1269451.1 B12-binding domain-containing radical SAM protein [Nanoarchaeota archaeon]MBU1604608.1 B12-binding domain-containing radical SAM protein [Nanoarchaeota archaeon]MBU2442758.1 B12-binding domain-containing radical SAM protein [Nanoarchaeota archaeon]